MIFHNGDTVKFELQDGTEATGTIMGVFCGNLNKDDRKYDIFVTDKTTLKNKGTTYTVSEKYNNIVLVKRKGNNG